MNILYFLICILR